MGNQRTFEDKPAVRGQVPLMIGLMGPSGGGKTMSALRLATGMQRVSGGDIFVVDTEARRALHYADRFKFRHVVFGAPFGPLDYLAAIEHCVAKGAKNIIVDSMSHEHEGPGGVLEMHAAEVLRMAGNDAGKAERVKLMAWSKPKTERRRMINSILQLPCNFIFCFRAKEKLKVERGKQPESMGFMPLAGEEFVYEMTLNALLLPNAGGIPTWQSEELGERMMIKLPEMFRQRLLQSGEPLSEDTGEHLARWAAGTGAPAPSAPQVLFSKNHKEWGGKPISAAPADVVVAYIAALTAVINDPKKEAAHAKTGEHLAAVVAEFDALRAEEELRLMDDALATPQEPDFDPETGEVAS